jgi:vitamin B12 transporter
MKNPLVVRAPLLSVATALVTVGPASAVAQETQDTIRLDELVVTATRLPSSPDAVVSSVTLITGEELRARGVRFVQDALREVPGAAVVQGGSYGGVSSLFLRGGESDYVKVLVDGVAVNLAGGSYNWANLTTDNLDRIEVLRGPASVIYGSDAVSGVVQIFTRRGRSGIGGEARAEAGSFGSVNGQAAVLGGTQHLSYSADASHLSTEGTYPFNNDYGNTVLSGSVRGLPNPRADAQLSVRYSDNRYHFPTDFAGFLADSNQANSEQALSLAADAGHRLGDRYELRIMAGGSRHEGEFDDPSDNPADTLGFAFASHRESRSERGSLDARVNGRLSEVATVTAGAQLERESERQSGETTSNFGGVTTTPDTPFDQDRTTLSYYAQGVLQLLSGLAVNVNGRLDDNSAFGTFFTYRVGAAYRLESDTRVRASVGRAFKAPTFCEQFCSAPFVVGDSTLSPERSTSWEAGLEQEFAAGKISVWGLYFHQQFSDMIVYDGAAAPGSPTYRNGAEARAHGVEVGIGTSPASGMKATASYTYLMAEATDDGGLPSASFAAGEKLIRRPTHLGELTLSGRLLDRATLGGSLVYVGSRDDVDFSVGQRVELGAYTLVDAIAEVELVSPRSGRPGLSGVLRIENVFNQDYDQAVGFPGRRRALFGGAKVQLWSNTTGGAAGMLQ